MVETRMSTALRLSTASSFIPTWKPCGGLWMAKDEYVINILIYFLHLFVYIYYEEIYTDKSELCRRLN